jgi:hypothetical protein
MRVLLVILVCAAVLRGSDAAAGGMLDRNATGEDVSASITSPFSDLPPGGCVPFEVTIRNDRDATLTWRITFQAASTLTTTGPIYYAQDLTVAPNATGVFDLNVPLPAVGERGNSNMSVAITGPGFKEGGAYNSFFGYIYSSNSGSTMPFCLIGKEVLGPAGTGPLESYYKGTSETYYGSEVDVAHLPSEWRAYSGVARIILRDSEWLELNSAQRGAIEDYVAQGGRLALLTTESPDVRTPELQLPTPAGKPGGVYGFGQITVQNVTSFPPDASTLQVLIEHDGASAARQVDLDFSAWGLRDRVGSFTVHTGFILSFVVLFGTLIGPVNLFVFARGKNRFRLFWTTPLISIAASAALILGILVTDGLGGTGHELVAIFSLPGVNREAVIQEQVARTAVLFSNRWHSDQDYLISPVSESSMNNAAAAAGYRGYSPATNLAAEADTYLQIGNDFSGNWFRSRSVSGQYLQAMRPSRSAVTVVNAAAVDAGTEPPSVISSFPGTLQRVYLYDNQGRVWTCEDLAPGRKEACVASTAEACSQFWMAACQNAGGKLRPLLNGAVNRPGCFYATGPLDASEALPTSGEIHWNAEPGVYLGPWVAASAGGSGS